MGRGVAAEAKARWPGIEMVLGRRNQALFGRTCALTAEAGGRIFLPNTKHIDLPYHIISFITKPGNNVDKSMLLPHYVAKFMEDDVVPGWACRSDIGLILKSVISLIEIADVHKMKRVALPPPGCGNGGLTWSDVAPLLRPLDDRFVVVDRHSVTV